MHKILVVFTGGTIGSTIIDGTIDTDKSGGYALIERFNEKYQLPVEWDTVQPFNILSENMTPYYWQVLCDTLRNRDLSSYKGIIVTHGSDTLPYTSAILSYVLRDINIPIVMVCSDYALSDPRSNGLENFYHAACFILNTDYKGVFAVYRNNKNEHLVHLGTRIVEADPYHDQFTSFGGEVFGWMEGEHFAFNTHQINPKLDELKNYDNSIDVIESIKFANNICVVKPYPGIDYEMFSFEKRKPKAVLHSLYHAATACTTGEKHNSLLHFIRRFKDEGIDVYLFSFKDISKELYSTSREILNEGGIPLENISFEAALTKLYVAYNQEIYLPQEYMKRNIFFEFLPRR